MQQDAPSRDKDAPTESTRLNSGDDLLQDDHTAQSTSSQSWIQRSRLTLMLMVGFTVAALVVALGHGCFFLYLHGTGTEDRFIHQSYVTTISLLLVTLYKSFLVAAVGLSFAQHIWNFLRRKSLPIEQIEQLFLMRSNLFQLARYHAAIEAPILFSMAVFVWVVPFAAIYPPSALTIAFQPYVSQKPTNVSVPFSSISSYDVGSRKFVKPQLFAVDYTSLYRDRFWQYTTPSQDVFRFGWSALMSGEISTIPPPSGDNATYSFEFMGPWLTCNKTTANVTEESSFEPGQGVVLHQVKWHRGVIQLEDSQFVMRYPSDLARLRTPDDDGSPRNYSDPAFMKWDPNTTYDGLYNMLTCRPKLITYEVVMTYNKSKQHVKYSTRDMKDFTDPPSFTPDKVSATVPRGGLVAIPTETDATMQQWERWAVLDGALQLLNYDCTFGRAADIASTYFSGVKLENGSVVQTVRPGIHCGSQDSLGKKALDTSVFSRNKPTAATVREWGVTPWDITESTLNAYIANVALSTMALARGTQRVNVTYTEFRTTYRVSAPLNLVLPYALTFVFGVLFVGMGIWSLWQNGASAIDGGFLQIMTTTIGRSRMEELVVQHHAEHDGDSVPKELLALKIRYGELVDGEGVGTGIKGFGTEEETKLLRKGWASG